MNSTAASSTERVIGPGVSSVAAAFVSDWFVTALTPALSVLHMSQAFAGLVVVAIAGNAVENVVGVQLAAKNKPDYAVEVILRSPVVIAFALMPLLVLVSPLLGGARLTLVLPSELLAVLVSSAVITAVVVFDGESTWLEGLMLIAARSAMRGTTALQHDVAHGFFALAAAHGHTQFELQFVERSNAIRNGGANLSIGH